MNRINYIGCKHTLISNILDVVLCNIKNYKDLSFADLFAGTGVVGFTLNNYCKNVISNDLEYYSYVLNNALLKCRYSNKIQNLINICNKLEPKEGIIYKNFSPNENCERMFFTNENSKKCDSIRIYIEKLKSDKEININEYYFLLASLIVSIDKVANTTSVYGAYLKKFKGSSLKPMIMMPIHKDKSINTKNKVYNKFVEQLVVDEKFDIVYLDPPYNQRQYSGNYSPLNYIALYDENVILKGKTGLIKDYNKSSFCSKVKVKDNFNKTIDDLNCKYIILSYNNEGILKYEDIKNKLSSKGKTCLYKIKYKKFKSNNKKTNDYVEEYIWFTDTTDKKNKSFEIIETELLK